jgi:hypothetical protein
MRLCASKWLASSTMRHALYGGGLYSHVSKTFAWIASHITRKSRDGFTCVVRLNKRVHSYTEHLVTPGAAVPFSSYGSVAGSY